MDAMTSHEHPSSDPQPVPSPPAQRPPGQPERAWRRRTEGEPRFASAVCILVAIGLQAALPADLSLWSRFLLPGVGLGLLCVLLVSNPTRLDNRSAALRAVGLGLLGVLAVANTYSAVTLVVGLVRGTNDSGASVLLTSGGVVYLVNILVFGVAYWELDRGGPADRAHGEEGSPDFLFIQMTMDGPEFEEWEPRFTDYLYVSFTNATAFSPTDTMPLTTLAKGAMMAQAVVAFVTVAMLVARAINILPG